MKKIDFVKTPLSIYLENVLINRTAFGIALWYQGLKSQNVWGEEGNSITPQ